MNLALRKEEVDKSGLAPQFWMSEQRFIGALKNFIRSPIFGGVVTVPSHSTIMECLQQNGIFGLAIWLGLYISSWKMIGKEMKNQNVDITLFNIVMFYLIALAFFNDTRYTFEITIAAFFITPIFSAVIQKE